MSATIIPFPNRSRPADWPDGDLGRQLDGLAVLLQTHGNRHPGPSITLTKAREAALSAYRDLLVMRQGGAES